VKLTVSQFVVVVCRRLSLDYQKDVGPAATLGFRAKPPSSLVTPSSGHKQ